MVVGARSGGCRRRADHLHERERPATSVAPDRSGRREPPRARHHQRLLSRSQRRELPEHYGSPTASGALPKPGVLAALVPLVVVGNLAGRPIFSRLAGGGAYEPVLTGILVLAVLAGLATAIL